MFGRVKGGRVWHLVSSYEAITVCGWKVVAEMHDLPKGVLCQKCYAIREEQGL